MSRGMPLPTASSTPPAMPPRSVAFSALRHTDYRSYFMGGTLAQMADNIEHVISYWILWETFHSPLLGGFAVISHWLPHLVFSVYTGALADRFDCRRIIQVAQALFMLVSLAWATLFLTDSLQVWHAVVLLSIHGLAGVLWAPASQMMIHDIVGREHLQSAIRLNATGRSLGTLLGPGIGGGMLLLFGPAVGLLVNALLYLPLIGWLAVAPYTGHRRAMEAGVRRVGLGLRDALRVLGEVSSNRPIIAMVGLAGLSSFVVGNAFQAQMPEFAHDLGTEQAGLTYTLLLGANAAGAVIGGVLLESTGLLRPRARTALLCAGLWCVTIAGFAMAQSYLLALALLVVSGMLHLTYSSMAQTLVQLLAAPSQRGRIIGVFNMGQQGLRVGSGFFVGVLGNYIGIHWSLALSAAVLFLLVLRLLAFLGPKDVESYASAP